MRQPSPRAEQEARIHDSLTRLAAARREKLSTEDYDVFVDGLLAFDADIVRQVCDDLGRVAPEDYQPRFPPLHVIREQCHRVTEYRRDRRLALKATTPEPADPERLRVFLEQVKAEVARKRMR